MTKSTKQLAIELAEKLGETYDFTGDGVNGYFGLYPTMFQPYEIDNYIKTKAAEILFQEGMAVRLDDALLDVIQKEKPFYKNHGIDIRALKYDWWRTLTPINVIELYLSMEEG